MVAAFAAVFTTGFKSLNPVDSTVAAVAAAAAAVDVEEDEDVEAAVTPLLLLPA